MSNLLLTAILFALFYCLGKSADLVIFNLRKIGERLGIKLFFLGLILGFFTSLPELAVGLNAILKDIQAVSLGNLLGGLMVLFGLILGASLVLNRQIVTGGRINDFWPILLYLLLPFFLGLKGRLTAVDGLILIAAYFLVIYFLYRRNKNFNPAGVKIIESGDVLKKIFLAFLGLVLVIFFSNFIVRLAMILLENFQAPAFLIGLVVFSLGTNLPEIFVALRSWRRRVGELSFSNLIGSSLANILIIGVLASIKNISVPVGASYLILFFFAAVLFFCLAVFYKTDKVLSRSEGAALLSIYILSLIGQAVFVL